MSNTTKSPKFPQLHDPDWLAAMIVDHKMDDIAAEIGCSKSGVFNALSRFGIERPTAGERRQLPWSDYVGQRFGMLVITGLGEPSPRSRNTRVTTLCDCGGIKIIPLNILLNKGHGWDHCGCQSSLRWTEIGQANATHGGRSRNGRNKPRTATYSTWDGMMGRCYRASCNGYENYGAEGITVCDEWHSFSNFLADMGERPEGQTLDRINVEGNYEPSNCRWATAEEQVLNKRQMLGFSQSDWVFISSLCLTSETTQGDKIAKRILGRLRDDVNTPNA